VIEATAGFRVGHMLNALGPPCLTAIVSLRERAMPRHKLYAYVDGADLDDVANLLDARFAEFVATRHWVAGPASVVNQRHGEETCTQPGDLPLWDLGLKLELPDPDAEPLGWFADVEAVAQFLGVLHRDCGRDFIIGIADAETGVTEDLFDVSTDSPDLGRLRAIIGVGDVP
jgi:hypothetical protein